MNYRDTALEAQLQRRPGQPTVATSSRAKELRKGEDLISNSQVRYGVRDERQ
jgi:hypothetical protein